MVRIAQAGKQEKPSRLGLGSIPSVPASSLGRSFRLFAFPTLPRCFEIMHAPQPRGSLAQPSQGTVRCDEEIGQRSQRVPGKAKLLALSPESNLMFGGCPGPSCCEPLSHSK